MSETAPHLGSRTALTGLAVAGLSGGALTACGSEETDTASDPTSPETTPASSADAGESQAPAGEALTKTADIPEGGGVIFQDQEVVVTQPTAGEFKCFSAICTHQGCLVSSVTETINCKCHNSTFALADGAPVSGLARMALEEKSITVDGDSIVLG